MGRFRGLATVGGAALRGVRGKISPSRVASDGIAQVGRICKVLDFAALGAAMAVVQAAIHAHREVIFAPIGAMRAASAATGARACVLHSRPVVQFPLF